VQRVGDRLRRDVPTCRLTDRLGNVVSRLRATGWDRCIVVNDADIVLGILRGKALEVEPAMVIEEVMDHGASTFRPDIPFEDIQHYLKERNLDSVVITTADGKLLGILPRTATA
jgi:CBS domain-containing protein